MSHAFQVQTLLDSALPQGEIAKFLHQAWPETTLESWQKRLAYWWNENPFHRPDSHHGFLARAEGRIVGFGGCIPAQYAFHGQTVPGIYATSFKVEPKYAQAASSIFLAQREMMKKYIIVHSTPLPRIQTSLLKMGARAETKVTCHYIALGKPGYFNRKLAWPALSSDATLVTDLTTVTALAQPYQKADQLEKFNSLESLKWYLASPMRQHHLIGAVDSQGVLTSFLMIAARSRRCLATWEIVESFTTRDDGEELLALIGTLVHQPDLLPERKWLLTVPEFSHTAALEKMPTLGQRSEYVSHYFLLPEELRTVPKCTVLAEGDLGL